MTRVTRRYKFAASHRLQLDQLSARENRELYGKCNNPYGHGHDYTLEIAVRGPIDRAAGQVINLNALDRLVQEQVIQDFDHRYLNSDIGEFRKLVPTSENILLVIEDRLLARWPQDWPRLEAIRLRETARNLFELKAN
jgi:6-pyruvoyltetrahydropterin/6-carboxytetrahydropterin synthase